MRFGCFLGAPASFIGRRELGKQFDVLRSSVLGAVSARAEESQPVRTVAPSGGENAPRSGAAERPVARYSITMPGTRPGSEHASRPDARRLP